MSNNESRANVPSGDRSVSGGTVALRAASGHRRRLACWSVVLLASWGLTGCTQGTVTSTVVATTGMIGDAAKRIAGEAATVSSLMGPGVDPHVYSPTEGDGRRLSRAKVILYNGLHLEGKMGTVLQRLRSRAVVAAVADVIPKDRLLAPPEYEGSYDPHVWFDVDLWTLVVDEVGRVLIDALPEHRDVLQVNLGGYRHELVELQAWVEKQVASVPVEQRVLVTAHDAFGYFGRRYGFAVIGLQGISTAAQAGLADIERVVAEIVERKVKAIFIESSVPRQTIEAVQASCASRSHTVNIGGELYSDALGPVGSGADTYIGMVRHNVTTIVEALR